MGDLTGEYIWFLMPIYSISEKDYGNAMAMEATEATGEESVGKATYFFRIVSRTDYTNYTSPEKLDEETDRFIKRINRCMIDINFRREPIYLPDERLDEPAYFKYKIATQRIPSLKLLRSLYIGRVIHASPEQWKNDVMDLLRFNVKTQDDYAKWTKQKQ
jgi:Txe/YoeB family toxin of Txe-Axe toxin-antitoxin module